LARKTVTDLMIDELWQLFEVGGSSQISTVNRITRLQRTDGETLGTSTHTVGDYKGVSDSVHEQLQATGFISRSRVKFVGPINANEIQQQQGLVEYTGPGRTAQTLVLLEHALAARAPCGARGDGPVPVQME
jgi:hypothetical protein